MIQGGLPPFVFSWLLVASTQGLELDSSHNQFCTLPLLIYDGFTLFILSSLNTSCLNSARNKTSVRFHHKL